MKLQMVGMLLDCLLLSYRSPVEEVENLLPTGLHPDIYRGQAFWNVVISQIGHLRLPGFPAWMGISYWHVAYRLHVHTPQDLHGLYFVRSDVNSSLIQYAGNILTDFRMHPAVIQMRSDAHQNRNLRIRSVDGKGDANIQLSEPGTRRELSEDSPFCSTEERSHSLKYRPLGLATRHGITRITRVQRDENLWRETPIAVMQAEWGFFESLKIRPNLEQATRVAPIPYRWILGETSL